MKQSFPLAWPAGKPRTAPQLRKHSDFGLRKANSSVTPDRAYRELRNEVNLLGGHDLIISTNVRLRVDGTPFRDERPVSGDPGVAVYFKRRNRDMVFACDKWMSVPENVWAIRKSIEALRGLERWGSKDMMEAAFTGFAQLAAPEQPWQVLGIKHDASKADVEKAFRRLAAEHHPDRGGDEQQMARINAARDALLN